MATTFIGLELASTHRARHAAVVLHRRKNGIELRHWSCLIQSDVEMLEYLTSMAGTSGVIAVHGGRAAPTDELVKRIWRVLDYRVLYALAPRHRTRALVRVQPGEVERAFAANGHSGLSALEQLRLLVPSVDFHSLTRCLQGMNAPGKAHSSYHATVRAALSAYAALWCWWHGPAGYDVLGSSADTYRLAPRLVDLEPDTDATRF